MRNGDKPAYPIFDSEGKPTFESFAKVDPQFATGLTKREYFAAMAMQGLIASCANPGALASNLAAYPKIPTEAIEYADELLKQLEQ